MLQAGTRLNDRYVLLEPVARGGMGEVWRADDTVLGRVVAVKVLLPSLSGEPGFAERFRVEARAMAALSDPNIVEVYDYGQAQGVAYLVMQFVPGEPLHALLRRVGPLPPDQAMTLVAQAARALHQAHSNGIVHRDVKPGNLLIRPDGRLVLTDFGIARIIAADHLVADTPVTVALMHARDEPPPLPAAVPEPVRHVVMQALAKDPRQRWPTAAEMGQAAAAAAAATMGALPVRVPLDRRPPGSAPAIGSVQSGSLPGGGGFLHNRAMPGGGLHSGLPNTGSGSIHSVPFVPVPAGPHPSRAHPGAPVGGAAPGGARSAGPHTGSLRTVPRSGRAAVPTGATPARPDNRRRPVLVAGTVLVLVAVLGWAALRGTRDGDRHGAAAAPATTTSAAAISAATASPGPSPSPPALATSPAPAPTGTPAAATTAPGPVVPAPAATSSTSTATALRTPGPNERAVPDVMYRYGMEADCEPV